MSTSSLRVRATVTTLLVLALALAGFATAVTLHYRSGLERDLRNRLTGGGLALSRAPSTEIKQLDSSLALDGIDVTLGRPRPAPTGAADLKRVLATTSKYRPKVRPEGDLLVLKMPVQEQQGKGSGPDAVVTATLTASRSSVDTPVRQLVLAEVIGGLITLTLAALLLLWGMRTALAPLAHVGRVAARIAGGDRTQRLNPARRDTELGRMAASFDEMVSALNAAVEQSSRSEAAMRRFLADASHELRTPIAALHATIETLLREQPPRPQRDALEAQLARESARLGSLVDDLLNLARLEGSDALDLQEVDLARVAEEIVAEARSRLPGVTIEISCVDGAAVTGDPDALGRALRNLLDNAAAATDGAGRLRVDLSRTEADVVLRVTDDGPGVSGSQRERIFEEFVRLDGDRRPGAGLGLAIVRRIAEQHHGTAVCEDTNRGACFALRLPAARRSFPLAHPSHANR